jgi:hypothetical protein
VAQSEKAESDAEILWRETKDRLQHFLPGFLDDVIPEPPLPRSATAATLTTSISGDENSASVPVSDAPTIEKAG